MKLAKLDILAKIHFLCFKHKQLGEDGLDMQHSSQQLVLQKNVCLDVMWYM